MTYKVAAYLPNTPVLITSMPASAPSKPAIAPHPSWSQVLKAAHSTTTAHTSTPSPMSHSTSSGSSPASSSTKLATDVTSIYSSPIPHPGAYTTIPTSPTRSSPPSSPSSNASSPPYSCTAIPTATTPPSPSAPPTCRPKSSTHTATSPWTSPYKQMLVGPQDFPATPGTNPTSRMNSLRSLRRK